MSETPERDKILHKNCRTTVASLSSNIRSVNPHSAVHTSQNVTQHTLEIRRGVQHALRDTTRRNQTVRRDDCDGLLSLRRQRNPPIPLEQVQLAEVLCSQQLSHVFLAWHHPMRLFELRVYRLVVADQMECVPLRHRLRRTRPHSLKVCKQKIKRYQNCDAYSSPPYFHRMVTTGLGLHSICLWLDLHPNWLHARRRITKQGTTKSITRGAKVSHRRYAPPPLRCSSPAHDLRHLFPSQGR